MKKNLGYAAGFSVLALTTMVNGVFAEVVEVPVMLPEPRPAEMMVTGSGDVLYLKMADGTVIEDPLYNKDDPALEKANFIGIYDFPFHRIRYTSHGGPVFFCDHRKPCICINWLSADVDVVLKFYDNSGVEAYSLDGKKLDDPFDFKERKLERVQDLEVTNFNLLEFEDSDTGETIWRVNAR